MLENKKTRRRQNSNESYLDALQEIYSKINVVRLDMSYKKPYSKEIIEEQATKDLNRLLNNRRSKPVIFKDNIGYAIKKEYTKDKGVHFHAFFMFDGQKVLKDSFKADEIGTYWNEQITKGKGTYYNCNRNKYPEHGIGMLEHRDTEKRKNLDKAMEYISKDDQSIKSLSEKKERSCVRGILPKSKGNIGRPRNDN
ncbi:inovirus-type Gp2 protein [Aliarcobacter butzleri]|uniref:YagK/YfjJ domain-containing protein n=1 Tax=Aliarcobacter butzleri TaxID=28197 RepID=UPI0024DE3B51|nr:inovirus-type Gp2 protein [Aliarcobacter butzleri]MDK2069865.1 inovirus-type Gp2 protein [Aliarcobacter butzleri]